MESNAWLALVTGGLFFEMFGVLFLIFKASKYLLIFQINAKRLRKRSKLNPDNFEIFAMMVENIKKVNTLENVPIILREISEINKRMSVMYYEISHIHNLLSLEKKSLKKSAKIPIFFLIIGFLLQIIGVGVSVLGSMNLE